MRSVTGRPLSERILKLREIALATPEPNRYFLLLRKRVCPGQFMIQGKLWFHFYSYCNFLFTENTVIPGIDLDPEKIPDWEEAAQELISITEPSEWGITIESPWDELPGLLFHGGNHAAPGYDQIIHEGFPARLERIKKRLEGEQDPEKLDFLQYLQIRCEAILIYFNRISGFLTGKAKMEKDGDRKKEILKLAEAYHNIARGPAKTFREAMLLHHSVYQELPDSPGCMDRYLEPFLQNDLRNGEITEEKAFEYICAAYIRFYEILGATDQRAGSCHFAIGGSYADGSSACGLCTELCMAAQASLKIMRPQIALRWAKGLPEDYLLRGIELLKESQGNTDFSNDEVFIPALVRAGIRQDAASTYTPSGCNEVMIPGESQMGALQGHFNLPLLLNILLGQITRPGISVPALESLHTFADFRKAFRTLQQDFFRSLHKFVDKFDRFRAETGFMVHLSLYTDDCIERALPIHNGGARYTGCNYDVNGFVNLADSMYIIKRLVYDEKRISLTEFAEILKADWQGAEPLLKEIRTKITHFGNDCDDVDSLAAELFGELVEDFDSEPPPRGGHYNLGTLGGYENAHVKMAEHTYATPDGRRNGEAFASGLSPWSSMDRNGLTAMLNSICRIPFDRICTSTIVNLMLPMSMLDTEDGRKKAAILLETYFRNGGIQAQMTVADKELLLAAEKEPEKYPDLVVRVSGYSAKFIALEPGVRAEIVRRTLHTGS